MKYKFVAVWIIFQTPLSLSPSDIQISRYDLFSKTDLIENWPAAMSLSNALIYGYSLFLFFPFGSSRRKNELDLWFSVSGIEFCASISLRLMTTKMGIYHLMRCSITRTFSIALSLMKAMKIMMKITMTNSELWSP